LVLFLIIQLLDGAGGWCGDSAEVHAANGFAFATEEPSAQSAGGPQGNGHTCRLLGPLRPSPPLLQIGRIELYRYGEGPPLDLVTPGVRGLLSVLKEFFRSRTGFALEVPDLKVCLPDAH